MEEEDMHRPLVPAILLCALIPSPTHAATARFTFTSDPGDFIGLGASQDISYDTADGDSIFPAIRESLPDGPAQLSFVVDGAPGAGGDDFALLLFGTNAMGIPIQPGVYTDAERASFANPGHPGLDVSYDHRGCNRVAGAFTIHDVTFLENQINTFSASFEQHCEGRDPALHGTFTYDAMIPEPTLALPVLASLLLLTPRTRCKRQAPKPEPVPPAS
jgi:hypothetical protein